MSNHKIFCSVPWTNIHIYWDGGFGACCSENHRPYSLSDKQIYNIKNMTIDTWINSEPMLSIRKQILSDNPLSQCSECYNEETHGYESRRIKENFKSVVFTEQAFDRSLKQSPMIRSFNRSKQTGVTDILPIDWHIDLGNECNLACKMCFPEVSSKIAAQYKQWNILSSDSNVFNSWTDDDTAWGNFLDSINQVDNLHRLHFMGGEPMLSKRFEPLMDYLIQSGKNNTISLSFVTNGTLYNQSIIDKIKKFKTCDIEISIESFDKTNDYIRQGSKIDQLKNNIQKFLSQEDEKLTVLLRSVPQLFSVNSYFNYIEWCLDNNVALQGIPIANPEYLKINVLPKPIRTTLIEKYLPVKQRLESITSKEFTKMATGRDKSRIGQQLLREVDSIISLLNSESDANVEQQRADLIMWVNKWDEVYKLNALEYYPEYADFLIEYGYGKT
jgi:sulfatase maturation enzyme AslB (radical SAM superfamily)